MCRHVFREVNQVADRVAKLGFSLAVGDWRLDPQLLKLIRLDAIGRPSFRL